MPRARTHYSILNNLITLHCSDGNPAFRPTRDELKRVVYADGTVDYMHECKGDDPTLKLWKRKIGSFLANHVHKAPDAKHRVYSLSSLPDGYSLFIHKKGPKDNPRQDAYLRGSSTVTLFRSPAEFFLHAKWIALGCPKPDPEAPMTDDEITYGELLPEELEDRCGCTYCYGSNQAYISRMFSNYTQPKRKAFA